MSKWKQGLEWNRTYWETVQGRKLTWNEDVHMGNGTRAGNQDSEGNEDRD